MLKIMKYDWKNGWNNVRSLLLLAAALSVVTGIIMSKLDDHAALAGIVWMAVMVALLVLTVNSIFQNMTTRMFGAQGYLTHTLPVDSWELLLGKTTGTWLFGVFMVFAAIACWMLLLLAAAATSIMGESFLKVIQALPKLADYHFPRILSGMGDVAMSILAFLADSFLLVMQFQFVCIAARQFGRYHIAGGIILFLVLCFVEGIWNYGESLGFLVVLLSSAACFAGSSWLLKHRLSV